MITSKSNQKLKKVKKLLSSARERRDSGLFVIEGVRLFTEAPRELVETVFISQDCPVDVSSYPEVEMVERGIFRELSDTVTPQGILAIVKQPGAGSESVLITEKKDRRLLLLDGIRDPGNLGTMIRTAEAAGVGAVWMSPDCVDLYNPKVIRSTMGSIFRVPAFVADLPDRISRLKAAGIPVYGTSLSAEKSYRDVDLSGAAIIIGSEANGISRAVSEAVTDNIRIPMHGKVESLNAAVSAAILMFA